MEEKNYKTGDLWSGLALAALGTYVIVAACQWDYLTHEGPGAGFFPLWYGIAMVLLSGALVVASVLRKRDSSSGVDWEKTGRALATWFAVAIFVALLKPLGFVLAFALLTFFIVAVMYRRPLKIAAAVAVAFAAGFYLVFPLALGLDLPAGLLGF